MKVKEDALKKIILNIENSGSSLTNLNIENQGFELCSYKWMTTNLSGGVGALFVRSILYRLGINEHHVFKWRLENKYIQYLTLNYYSPNCMPKTLSFSQSLDQANGILKIRELFKKGFFIKKTLGHSSGSNGTFDRTAEFENILYSHKDHHRDENEKWILQKKLNLKNEFRIHTFSRKIIHGLTFELHGLDCSDIYTDAEMFLERILEKLPDNILQGTLIGWDVGLTNDRYYVIEANFTGFHPEFHRGFQTTGYVEDNTYGPIICTWLNSYFKLCYGVYIDSIQDTLLSNFPFYRACVFYMSIFKNIDIEAVSNKTKGSPISTIIYLGSDENDLVMNLLYFFQKINFTRYYYVIVESGCIHNVGNLLGRKNNIKILEESSLFTESQYQLINQLGYERRGLISCYHALRMINDEFCIMI